MKNTSFTLMQPGKIAPGEKREEAPRVLKVSVPEGAPIANFEMATISRRSATSPAATAVRAARATPLAPPASAVSQKDRRFAMSALVQDPAALEAEARELIEHQVQVRLHDELERVRQAAFEQGHVEGVQAGNAAAHAEYAAKAQPELERLQAIVTAFEGAKAEIFAANERYLTELFFRMGRMLFLKELATDKEYLSRLARELVERAGVRENIRIRLHPRDADQVARIKAHLQSTMGELRNLSIEIDSGITSGGLELQTEWSALDASVDTQLKAIHEALTGCSS